MSSPNESWVPREVVRLVIPEKHYLISLLKELIRNRLEPSHGSRPISLRDATWCHFDDSDFEVCLHIIAELEEPCGWIKSRSRRYDEGYVPGYLMAARQSRGQKSTDAGDNQPLPTRSRKKPKQ